MDQLNHDAPFDPVVLVTEPLSRRQPTEYAQESNMFECCHAWSASKILVYYKNNSLHHSMYYL